MTKTIQRTAAIRAYLHTALRLLDGVLQQTLESTLKGPALLHERLIAADITWLMLLLITARLFVQTVSNIYATYKNTKASFRRHECVQGALTTAVSCVWGSAVAVRQGSHSSGCELYSAQDNAMRIITCWLQECTGPDDKLLRWHSWQDLKHLDFFVINKKKTVICSRIWPFKPNHLLPNDGVFSVWILIYKK